MSSRTAVERVLARVRPFLAAGGDIELVEVSGRDVCVRLRLESAEQSDAPVLAAADDDEPWAALAGGPLDAPTGEETPVPAATPTPVQGSTMSRGLERLGGLSLDEYLRRVEAECIASALAASGGNKSRAARLLGIKRSTLGDRITRGLKTED